MTSIISRPIEIDSKFYVEIIMDGHALQRQGPYRTRLAAEAAAHRAATVCRSVFSANRPPQAKAVFGLTPRKQRA